MRRIAAALLLLAACGQPDAVIAPDPAPAPSSSAEARVVKATEPASEPTPGAPEVESRRAVVILVPLRSFPDDLLDEVEETLERELAVEVRRHDPVPLPKSAYYEPRRRYRADKLIDHLLTFAQGEPETTRVLGLTEVDISTTKGEFKDWGVFGLGDAPGQSAVVSSFRLKRKAKHEKVLFRVANTALHEVGHTFGLQHCEEARCPMQDAEGSIENTDGSTGHLGPQCQAELDEKAPRGG